MADPRQESTVDAKAEAAAQELGRLVVGRELTGDERAAMSAIFKAAVQALRHGFINRLAEQVRAERETETVEEFFQDLKPD